MSFSDSEHETLIIKTCMKLKIMPIPWVKTYVWFVDNEGEEDTEPQDIPLSQSSLILTDSQEVGNHKQHYYAFSTVSAAGPVYRNSKKGLIPIFSYVSFFLAFSPSGHHSFLSLLFSPLLFSTC